MKNNAKNAVSQLWCCIHFLLMLTLFIQGMDAPDPSQLRAPFLVYALALFFLSRLYGCYKVGLMRLGELFYSFVIADLLSWVIGYAACATFFTPISLRRAILFALIRFTVTAIWLLIANKLYFRLHSPRRTVIFYHEPRDLEKLEEVRFFEAKWKVTDRIIIGSDEVDSDAIMSHLQDCETVFVSGLSGHQRDLIAATCIRTGRDCYFVPRTGDVIAAGASHIRTFAVPVLRVMRRDDGGYALIKRLFDILAALCGLVILSPVMLIAAIAVYTEDRGPILFRQTRLTKDGQTFTILKFRSMKVDAEADGARLSGANDPRVTKVGAVLRSTRMDELPQMVNILRGEMSLVGPRPERPELAAEYEKTLPEFALRLQVKAGLTGYAQVYGRYSTEPADKLKMDLMYINRIGPVEDLKIIFATFKVLLDARSSR